MKKVLLLIFVTLTITACTVDKYPPLSPESNIIGLASLLSLNVDQTEVPLSDFYLNTDDVEHFNIIGLPDSLFSMEAGLIRIQSSAGMPAILALEVTANGITEVIPLLRSGKQAVELQFDPGDEQYENVTVRGEFNGWTAGRPDFELKDGIWKATLMLSPGTYQYLLVVDGVEGLDPANHIKIDNNMGGFNSLLSVGLDIADKVPVIFTDEYDGDDIGIGFEREVEGLFVLWQNILLPEAYFELEESGEYEIGIPEAAKNIQRSYIRVWAWNAYGVSNDILIPLEYGKVLNDPALITRFDMHSMILYNAFVDRFYDADPSNNRPLNQPEVLPAADYHGGDIKGISQKIRDGYFKDLGVNTLWISPLIKNPEGAFGYWPEPPSKFSGYHGYWPISFTLIDDRYGNEEDLHELVGLTHENAMNVLLDIVANHVHQEHPVYQEHPDWATELYLPDGSLNTERWDEYRLTTWFDVFLPTLDLANPEVYEMLSDSAVYWIKKYQLDGFRHDATKHVPEVFWRTLTRKLKEQVTDAGGRQLYQIGETYGGPDLINSYIGTGMLDGQFDFNVYDDALAVFIRPDEPFSRLDASLKESMQYYGAHNLMGYITGNQDRGRFTSYAGGDLHFDEDAKMAGWTRDIEVGDEAGYKVTEMLFAFNMTIPGLPVIYYGDEIGMAGGNDPDSRRMMRFDALNEHELNVRNTAQKLTELRSKCLPLIYGDFVTLLVTDQTYVYCRTYFDDIVIVLMNKDTKAKTLTFEIPDRFGKITLKSHFGSEPEFSDGSISVSLEPGTFDIYTAEN
ncbi:MAG: hypothetical protein KAT76_01745 [Bacteroidales bacterium]|nr:hypothetical protein [Bacteroidales bacterium]